MTIICIIPAYSIPPDGKQCGLLTFYCDNPGCKRWHLHSSLPGHRIAHCQDDLHYPSGYELELAGPLDEAIIKQYPNRKGLPIQYQTARVRALMERDLYS